MKEANATLPMPFAEMFTGSEPNTLAQMVAMELKLTDAVFAATLAPYNRGLNNARPFSEPPMNNYPKALMKFLFVALQRSVFSNQTTQLYFCSRSARLWEPETKGGLGKATPPLLPAQRKWKLWQDIIMGQGEDPLGATVTLSQLLSSSRKITEKLVNESMVQSFRALVQRCGPEPRLINLFTAVCFVEGMPERFNQELCFRMLWLEPSDRYTFGATFHECPGAKARS